MAKKIDRKLVASQQRHEVRYINEKFKVPMAEVIAAMNEAGRSRAQVYKLLRKWGWKIKTRNYPDGFNYTRNPKC